MLHNNSYIVSDRSFSHLLDILDLANYDSVNELLLSEQTGGHHTFTSRT